MSKILDSLEPDFKAKIIVLIDKLREMGIIVKPISGRRTISDQAVLWNKGRDDKGKIIGNIVTKARPGYSPHNYGEGCDLCPVNPKTQELWWNAPDDIWNVMHRVAENIGLVPGYDFKSIVDKPHIESKTWREKRDAWEKGKLQIP